MDLHSGTHSIYMSAGVVYKRGLPKGKHIVSRNIDILYEWCVQPCVHSCMCAHVHECQQTTAKKIKAMKDNKSPGVDGIPPKLLMETVEQISIPLARVFNLSLKEGVVSFEWKEANIIPLFKKGSRNK